MTSIAIITIVVVAILTSAIFCLTWIGFSSCIRAYKIEVEQGKHDIEICNKFYNKKRKQVIVKILCYAMTFILLSLVLGLFILGVIYSAQNEVISVNGITALVIKSDSMSDFFNDELKEKYKELNYNLNLQFSKGDICIFKKVSIEDSLIIGEVYAYKCKDVLITHRLVKISCENDKTYYIFRGDNNPSKDQILVKKEDIVYQYNGQKIPALGLFILYAKSYLGIWSLLSICGIIISSDFVLRKIQNIEKERLESLGGNNEK